MYSVRGKGTDEQETVLIPEQGQHTFVSPVSTSALRSSQHPVTNKHSIINLGKKHAPLDHIFPHISQTPRFSKNVTEHKVRVSICSTILSESFLILGRIERDMIKNIYCF